MQYANSARASTRRRCTVRRLRPRRKRRRQPGCAAVGLVVGAGDRGAGDAAELGQCRVGQLNAQVNQGDQDPVGEDQLVARPRRPACALRRDARATRTHTAPNHGSANSSTKAPRCARSRPRKAG
jgi:hypothetical protein